jgi:hypothetical protein
MCRLSTGGGFSTRELYSDDGEMIFDAMRPQMFNGITDVATRPDLLDRSILITLEEIDEAERKPEDELWRAFYEARPRILGALLDALAVGLANVGNVTLGRSPRMADFAKWVTACEPGLGWAPGTFMRAYTANRASANESAIESSAIGTPLVSVIETREGVTATCKDLMHLLEESSRRTRTIRQSCRRVGRRRQGRSLGSFAGLRRTCERRVSKFALARTRGRARRSR